MKQEPSIGKHPKNCKKQKKSALVTVATVAIRSPKSDPITPPTYSPNYNFTYNPIAPEVEQRALVLRKPADNNQNSSTQKEKTNITDNEHDIKKLNLMTSYSISGPKSKYWDYHDDKKLIDAVNKCGLEDWPSIVSATGRDEADCRKRWNQVLRPGIKKGTWSEEEDNMLRLAIQQKKEQNGQT